MPPQEPNPPSLSPRSLALQPFLVMEVLERAQALEREGRSIVHLEVGEPGFDTPPEVTAAGRAALDAGETHYTHSLGLRELREAICDRYRSRYGVAVSRDQIVVTTGSSPALVYLFGALIQPGDEVILAAPYYPCYPNFIRFFGGVPVEAPTDATDGYRLDPDSVRSLITARTRAILINSPANPTGAVLDAGRLRALADLGLPIVSDEIYHELVYEGRAPSILEFTDNAYVLDGFSKRYAMTGWRLGYLVAPPAAARTFQIMQQNFLISASPFVQRGGIAALREADAAVAAMREVYREARGVTVELFRDLGFGIPVVPDGAFYVFADASRFTNDSLAFAFELLERTGVAVTPGVDFGEYGRRAIRISYAAPVSAIREAARRLGEYLAGR